MNDWNEDDAHAAEHEEPRRILDQRMLREPIRTLNPRQPITVAKGSTVADAIELMKANRVGCVLVTEGEHLAGILTERDLLLKVSGSDLDVQGTPVDEVMTPDPEVLRPENAIVFALNKMSVGGFRHVPLVDDAMRPVGVVSMHLIVDYLVEFFPREVLNIPGEPGRNVTREREGA